MRKLSKALYRCISEGLMHVATWYHGTPPPIPELMKFWE